MSEDGQYLACAITWRKDAKIHIYEVGTGLTLCGRDATEGWAVGRKDPTCRECSRAFARLSQQHPAIDG